MKFYKTTFFSLWFIYLDFYLANEDQFYFFIYPLFCVGQFKKLHGLLLEGIIPSTVHYMTYQGSLPFPACYETVTWIILNQPVIITETQVNIN